MIAICIGHSRKIKGRYDGGAYSPFLKINERDFNIEVANKLSDILEVMGIDCRIIDHYEGGGYGSAMTDMARQVKGIGATMAIELHFNSATPLASGHEWLIYPGSKGGRKIANAFDAQFRCVFTNLPARGVKERTKNQNGGRFLAYTHCPSVILEPFFGSNSSDCARITVDSLALVYATAIGKALS